MYMYVQYKSKDVHLLWPKQQGTMVNIHWLQETRGETTCAGEDSILCIATCTR